MKKLLILMALITSCASSTKPVDIKIIEEKPEPCEVGIPVELADILCK
jgi:hypothetical protein